MRTDSCWTSHKRSCRDRCKRCSLRGPPSRSARQCDNKHFSILIAYRRRERRQRHRMCRRTPPRTARSQATEGCRSLTARSTIWAFQPDHHRHLCHRILPARTRHGRTRSRASSSKSRQREGRVPAQAGVLAAGRRWERANLTRRLRCRKRPGAVECGVPVAAEPAPNGSRHPRFGT